MAVVGGGACGSQGRQAQGRHPVEGQGGASALERGHLAHEVADGGQRRLAHLGQVASMNSEGAKKGAVRMRVRV